MKKVTDETRIKREIKDWLSVMGFFHFPITQGMGSYRGIPDIIAVKRGITVFIEVKTPRGRQSDYQIQFQKNLETHGGCYCLATGYETVESFMRNLSLL